MTSKRISQEDSRKMLETALHLQKTLAKHPEAQIIFVSSKKAKKFIEIINDDDRWPIWTNGTYVWKKEDIFKTSRKDRRNLQPCGMFI